MGIEKSVSGTHMRFKKDKGEVYIIFMFSLAVIFAICVPIVNERESTIEFSMANRSESEMVFLFLCFR